MLKSASTQKNIDSRERVFFIRPQALEAPSKNALNYDECMSGSIIYAYVGGNPLSRVDPTGLLYVAIRVEFSGMFIVLHNVDGPGFNVPTYEGLFQIPNAPCNFLCFIKDKDWDKARQDSDPNRLAGLNPNPPSTCPK